MTEWFDIFVDQIHGEDEKEIRIVFKNVYLLLKAGADVPKSACHVYAVDQMISHLETLKQEIEEQ